MIVFVNGTQKELRDGAVVTDAIAIVRSDVTGRGVAVAVNGTVVPRGAWAATELNESDRVEVLTAVAGG